MMMRQLMKMKIVYCGIQQSYQIWKLKIISGKPTFPNQELQVEYHLEGMLGMMNKLYFYYYNVV
ncbi:hypothetical protein X975_20703, partial [Stegodyphus mimosarum]